MRGRYEVSGLPLHPLVSPGGKLTFLKSKNAVRLTCPTSLFCTLCMLHVFKQDYICIKWTYMLWSSGFLFFAKKEKNLMIDFHSPYIINIVYN